MPIPRLHKETSIFDPDSTVEKGVADASTKATSYLTTISGTEGISVHDAGDESNYVNITSGLVNIVTGGISRLAAYVAGAVAKVRVGDEAAGHAIFSPDGMEVFTDADTSVAKFGETVRVGPQGGLHQDITGTATSFVDGEKTVAYISTDKFYSVNAEVEDAFYIGNYSVRNASDGKLVIGLRR